MNKTFENNVLLAYREAGRVWLNNLPFILEATIGHWDLADFEEFDNLSFNYVGACKYKGQPAVLKLCCNKKDYKQEVTSLKIYNEHSCIKLIDNLSELNAMLLEQAILGNSLEFMYPNQDAQAVTIAANIMLNLHGAKIQINADLPTLKEWLKDLFEPPTTFESEHLAKAQNLANELLESAQKVVLLHGDLHHTNILLNNNNWVAIDPKGILGDPAFEVCSFIRNPKPEVLKPIEIIVSRLKLFSKLLNIPAVRLKNWVYVNAVLNACWAINDGENSGKALEEAELVDKILLK